jgi:hypothetical protein
MLARAHFAGRMLFPPVSSCDPAFDCALNTFSSDRQLTNSFPIGICNRLRFNPYSFCVLTISTAGCGDVGSSKDTWEDLDELNL